MKRIMLFTLIMATLGLYAHAQLSVRSKADAVFTTFPKTVNIKTSTIVSTSMLRVRDILVFDNSLLLVNLGESNRSILSLVDIKNKTIAELGLKPGYGANELIIPIQSGLLPNNDIYLFDPMLKKLVIGGLGNDGKWAPKDARILKDGYYSFKLLNDSVGLGFGSHGTLGKIQRLNTITSVEKDLFGVFTNMPTGYKPGSWKHAHEGFLFLKPDRTKLVLAHRYFDKIEIFNLENNTSKSVSGPKNIALSATPFSTQGMDVIMTNEKTLSTYTNGYATDQFIFCLFSNAFESSSNSNTGKDIFVFTWDGKPVVHLVLSEAVSAFAISKDIKMLYGYSPKKQEVVSAPLNF
jgi:hypothetical protein